MPESRICDYEGSNYRTEFWEGKDRDYEDRVERVALRRMLPPQGRRLLEIGAGFGRLTDEYAAFDQVAGDLIDFLSVPGDFRSQADTQVAESEAAGKGVDEVHGFAQRGGQEAGRRIEKAVFHLTIRENQHDQSAIGGDGDELYMADRRFVFRGQDEAGALGDR